VKITIEATDRIVNLTDERRADGVPGRVWEGTTESGIAVFVVVTRIAAHRDADLSQFEAELQECRAPSAEGAQVFPLRLIL
jgi:hypothetical protein